MFTLFIFVFFFWSYSFVLLLGIVLILRFHDCFDQNESFYLTNQFLYFLNFYFNPLYHIQMVHDL